MPTAPLALREDARPRFRRPTLARVRSLQRYLSSSAALLLLPYTALVSVHAILGWRMLQPHLFADELGYLGHARYLAGVGHMPDMGTTTYYHFGYSLLLVPAFWLFPDPAESYRAVIVTNAFLISLLFFPLYYLLHGCLQSPRRAAIAAALVTCLYPAYLLQSNLAWAENAVIPGYAGVVAAFGFLVKRGTPVSGVLFGLLTAFLYAAHPRMLPLLPIAVVLLLVLAWRRVVPWTTALLGIACIVIAYEATSLANDHLRSIGWSPRRRAIQIAGRLSRALSWSWVSGSLVPAAGQLLYLVQASLGLFLIGLWYLVSEHWRGGFRALLQFRPPVAALVLSYALLSSAALFFISAVSIGRGARADHLVYGRYNEAFLSVYIALALLVLGSAGARVPWRTLLPGTVVVTALLTWAVTATQGAELASGRSLVPPNVLGIYPLVLHIGYIDPLRISLVAGALFAIIVVVFSRTAMGGLIAVAVCFGVGSASDYRSAFLPIQSHLAGANRLPEHVRQLGRVRVIGYDQTFYHRGSVPLRFFSYQFLLPEVAFKRFWSARGDMPPTDVLISGVGWPDAERLGARLFEVENDANQALWILPGPLQAKAFPATYLGFPLGAEMVRGVRESGFYSTERDPTGRPFRWTDGAATLVVPMFRQRASTLTVELMDRRPQVEIRVNGHRVFEGRFPVNRARTFDISSFVTEGPVTIELVSATFVPADRLRGSNDRRTLGVRVGSVLLE